jgi:hypothetical protein
MSPADHDHVPPARPKAGWLVPALVAGYLIAYIIQVRHLPVASTAYPYLLIALIGGGLAWLGFATLRDFRVRSKHPADEPGARMSWRMPHRFGRGTALAVMAMLYPALLPYLGFAIATFLLLAGLLPAFGERRPWRILAIAAVISILFFAGVDSLLGIPLPTFRFAELPLGI